MKKKFRSKEGKEEEDLSILVVGLGNRNITPDALGPCGRSSERDGDILSGNMENMQWEWNIKLVRIVPGVMGQTGMETTEIVRGIIRENQTGSCDCW